MFKQNKEDNSITMDQEYFLRFSSCEILIENILSSGIYINKKQLCAEMNRGIDPKKESDCIMTISSLNHMIKEIKDTTR